MDQHFAYCKAKIKKQLCKTRMARVGANSYTLQMAKNEFDDEADDSPNANHLRAWREFREMKQAELAEKVGTNESMISLLESGKRGLSLKWLNRLAPALNTTPGYLLDHDPNDLPTDMLDLWQRVPAADRPRALEAIRIFEKRDRSAG